MEARIARLESDIGHLRSDVTEVKVNLRGLRDQLSSSIDRLAEQTNNRFDNVIAKIDGLGPKRNYGNGAWNGDSVTEVIDQGVGTRQLGRWAIDLRP